MTNQRTVRVGLLGLGIVGGATARILIERSEDLAQRAGARIELVSAAVKTLTKPREIELPDGLLTGDAWAVVNDPEVDVIVEAIGGIEPARDLILAAIKSGKHVVTANKELMSTLGREVMDAAEAAGVDVLFEASVGGGIPIIRPLKESLAGERVRRVMGIVNGTTNFILTRMSETGESFAEALVEAERLGYTELDPSADIEGFDAAAKLAILASLAFNARVVAGDVDRQGISRVTASDIQAAHELGYVVKLLAIAEEDGGQISAHVHPAMLPQIHPLAAVRDVFNAVFVEGDEVGELMFFGRGAGGGPTGTAVVGDLVEVVRNIVTGGRSPGCTCYRDDARMRSPDEAKARYYIVLSVADQAGVLSSVAGVFAQHDVSIASVRQEGSGEEASLVLITHVASEGQHQLTLRDLATLPSVKSVDSTMRVVGTAEA
jgi:homoserine dehydrogenase